GGGQEGEGEGDAKSGPAAPDHRPCRRSFHCRPMVARTTLAVFSHTVPEGEEGGLEMARQGGQSEGTELRLGKYGSAVTARLARWQQEGFGRRLWQKDPTL